MSPWGERHHRRIHNSHDKLQDDLIRARVKTESELSLNAGGGFACDPRHRRAMGVREEITQVHAHTWVTVSAPVIRRPVRRMKHSRSRTSGEPAVVQPQNSVGIVTEAEVMARDDHACARLPGASVEKPDDLETLGRFQGCRWLIGQDQ